MPQIELTDTFKKNFAALPKAIQKKVSRMLRFLADDPRHPSLQSKPIRGARGLYEARVDRFYRLTYERLPGDVLRLRVVGRHDEALRGP